MVTPCSNSKKRKISLLHKTFKADAVYFRRGVTCTLRETNDLIDGGQPRAKPHLRKAKPNHVLKTVFSPRLATVYDVVGYPKSTRYLVQIIKLRLKNRPLSFISSPPCQVRGTDDNSAKLSYHRNMSPFYCQITPQNLYIINDVIAYHN